MLVPARNAEAEHRAARARRHGLAGTARALPRRGVLKALRALFRGVPPHARCPD